MDERLSASVLKMDQETTVTYHKMDLFTEMFPEYFNE